VALGSVSFQLQWRIRIHVFDYDVDQASIERARQIAARAAIAGLVSFERIAAEELSFEERFDAVMAFNCIHDMAQPRSALASIRQIVKVDSVFLWSEARASDRLEENLDLQGRTMWRPMALADMARALDIGVLIEVELMIDRKPWPYVF
jgi:SAM-dependent methyltransferase